MGVGGREGGMKASGGRRVDGKSIKGMVVVGGTEGREKQGGGGVERVWEKRWVLGEGCFLLLGYFLSFGCSFVGGGGEKAMMAQIRERGGWGE